MKNPNGWTLLDSWVAGYALDKFHQAYRSAVQGYICLPRHLIDGIPLGSVASSYDQLLTRLEVIVAIRNRFEKYTIENVQDSNFIGVSRCVAEQIKKILPVSPFAPNEQILSGLIEGITRRLKLNHKVEEELSKKVMDNLLGGKKHD